MTIRIIDDEIGIMKFGNTVQKNSGVDVTDAEKIDEVQSSRLYEECIRGIENVVDRILNSRDINEKADEELKAFWSELDSMGRADDADAYFTAKSLREMDEAIALNALKTRRVR